MQIGLLLGGYNESFLVFEKQLIENNLMINCIHSTANNSVQNML